LYGNHSVESWAAYALALYLFLVTVAGELRSIQALLAQALEKTP
jgi:hypothetical protein